MARALITGVSGFIGSNMADATPAAGLGRDRGQEVPGRRSHGGGEPVRPRRAGWFPARGRGPESHRLVPQGLQVGLTGMARPETSKHSIPDAARGRANSSLPSVAAATLTRADGGGAPGMQGSQRLDSSWRSRRQPLSSFGSAAVRRRLRGIQHRPGAGFRSQYKQAHESGPLPGRQASRHCRILQAAGGPRT
jgi:hypothetical protein